MWILIPIALAILMIMLLGPAVTMVLAFAGAVGVGLFGGLLLVAFALVCMVTICFAGAWCIWWVFDRPGATAALRAAERDAAARRDRR